MQEKSQHFRKFSNSNVIFPNKSTISYRRKGGKYPISRSVRLWLAQNLTWYIHICIQISKILYNIPKTWRYFDIYIKFSNPSTPSCIQLAKKNFSPPILLNLRTIPSPRRIWQRKNDKNSGNGSDTYKNEIETENTELTYTSHASVIKNSVQGGIPTLFLKYQRKIMRVIRRWNKGRRQKKKLA